jgi:hypothetical protein
VTRAARPPGRPRLAVEDVATRLSRYLAQAMLDPTLPATKTAICSRLGLAPSTLHDYRAHTLIAPLLRRWAGLKRARVAMRDAVPSHTAKSATVTEIPNNERKSVDEIVLASEYEQYRRRAIEAMQQFVFHHRTPAHVSLLPLCARDLGRAFTVLSGIHSELQSLADRWVNRR